MAQTQTRRPQQQRQAPPTPPATGLPAIAAPRLPYHPAFREKFGVDSDKWRALIDTVWPGAKTIEGVILAMEYCTARRLDPMKRPVHIVPIYSRVLNREVESVWPGINEVRITATRTGLLAGWDATEFGPMKKATLTNVAVEFPEWARVTVYRLDANGMRQAYPGPTIRWMEYYAPAGKDTLAPNDMWKRKPSFMVEKCAFAGALRAAFPEELGNQYSAEEMWGQVLDHVPVAGEAPPRPRLEDYQPTQTESASPVQQQERRKEFPHEPFCSVVDLQGEIERVWSADEADPAIRRVFDEAHKRDSRLKPQERKWLKLAAQNNAVAINALGHSLTDYYVELAADLDPLGLKPPVADMPDFQQRWNAIQPPQEGDRHGYDEAIGSITDLLATATAEDLAKPLLTTPLAKAMPDQHRARIADAIRRRNAQLKGEAGND